MRIFAQLFTCRIMKRNAITKLMLTALMVVLCFNGQVFGKNVDLKSAQQAGAYFLSHVRGEKSYDAEAARLVYEVRNPLLNIPAAYLFNVANKGFVVVAGSDCADPIIAFSDKDTLDVNNMAPAFQWWIEGYSRSIMDLQNEEVEASVETISEWDQLFREKMPQVDGTKENVEINFPEKWDQVYPYNLYCPTLWGEQCPAGCVATAIGQIMHYYRYPTVGKSVKPFRWPYTTSNNPNTQVQYESMTVRFSDSVFNYDMMPNSLTSRPAASLDQKREVSHFLLNIGLAVGMSYTPDGSGAVSQYVPSNINKYFGYPMSNYVVRTNYSDEDWVNLIKNEIDNGRPVYYDGTDPQGSGRDAAGHAFVCYGYRVTSTISYFAFNWGWGGSSDCYCNMRASNLGAGYYNFSVDHGAIINFERPAEAIADVNASDKLYTAYPNPASAYVTIPYALRSQKNAEMQILSVDGRVVETVRLTADKGEIKLNVSNYPHGVYIYRYNGQSNKFIVR